jgi:hypothetical protein
MNSFILEHHDFQSDACDLMLSQIPRFYSKELEQKFIYMNSEEIKNYFIEIDEERLRQSFLVLAASIEARFRIDYDSRVSRNKPSDNLTSAFQRIDTRLAPGTRPRLHEDILQEWKYFLPNSKRIFSRFSQFLKDRHWLAHGRYRNFPDSNWENKFSDLRLLDLALDNLPLQL